MKYGVINNSILKTTRVNNVLNSIVSKSYLLAF